MNTIFQVPFPDYYIITDKWSQISLQGRIEMREFGSQIPNSGSQIYFPCKGMTDAQDCGGVEEDAS